VAEAARGARLRTEIAVAHAAGYSRRRAFIKWVSACEAARGEALAVDHCDETRLRNGFNTLWDYVVAQRHKEAQRRTAVRHRYVQRRGEGEGRGRGGGVGHYGFVVTEM
jgi:hypothetical protein